VVVVCVGTWSRSQGLCGRRVSYRSARRSQARPHFPAVRPT